MRAFAGSFVLQLRLMARKPDDLLLLVNTPLLTVALLAIFENAERRDLGAYAIVGPAVMAVFQMALFVSGEMIAAERGNALFEATLTTPARYSSILLGRTLAVTLVSFLALIESILVGALFGVFVSIHHPVVFAATLATTAFAMTGTAVAMASLFVLSRSARTFQNALSYPFFVLGGVVVPVAFLPTFVQPLSWIVFLSWSSGLLRASLMSEPIPDAGWRLAAVASLGLVALAVGELLLRWTLNRARVDGTTRLA